MRSILTVFLQMVFVASAVYAQAKLPDIGIQGSLALGVAKNVGTQKIELETKDGAIDVVLQPSTEIKRLPPDNLKLSAASDAVFEDIAAGDRLLVTGKVADDKSTIYSTKIFIVKASDLEEQAEKQRREWQMRGIAGKVTAVDPAVMSLTVKINSLIGTGTEVTLTPKDGARFLRYAPTSARYRDAVASEFSGISVGDNLQALGDRTEDGKSFAAEEVITGGFITVAGAVKSIDSEKGEVTITEFGSGNEIIVVVNQNSLLKKFPEEMAQRMAMLMSMRQNGAGGEGSNAAGRQGGGAASGNREGGSRGGRPGAGGAGPGGRRGAMDINQIAARFPDILIGDIIVGDQIAVSSPKPDDPARVVAIKLLAGVGPFLAAQSTAGRGRARGVSGSLSIPGLEGLDF